jgi:formamidopyrimidine-DNA glycosylase
MRLSGGDSVLIHLGMSGRMNLTSRPPNAETRTSTWCWRPMTAGASGSSIRGASARSIWCRPRRRTRTGCWPDGAGAAGRRVLRRDVERGAGGQAHADQGGAAGSAARRRIGQHLCLRGAVPGADFAARLAHTVPGARAARLVPAIKATLTEAIAAGGSSLRDYVQPDGELGYFQHAWKVYGREGERCEECPGEPGAWACGGSCSRDGAR